MKYPTLTKDLDLHLLSLFQYFQVFIGAGIVMSQYSIYNNFSVFCKNFNLESKTIF